MARIDMKEYARRGAEARLTELRAEIAEIYRAFPGLRRGRPSADGGGAGEEMTGGTRQGRKRGRRRTRRPMSDEQKRKVSQRMKRWWAEQRKAKGAAK